MPSRRWLWISLAASGALLLVAAALALPRLRAPKQVGGINVDWRRDRCVSSQEAGLNPRWTEGTYTNIRGDSWDRSAVCELSLPDGSVIFHDGCSGQFARPAPPDGETWGTVHHDACVRHDHCYHHNPKTYAKDKATCDRDFHDDMLTTCEQRFTGDELDRCRRAARKMSWGVSFAAQSFFEYCDYPAAYEGVLQGTEWSGRPGGIGEQ